MSKNHFVSLERSKLNKFKIDCIEIDCEEVLKTDKIEIFSGTNDIDFTNARLRNITDPIELQDCATKKYVDDEISGVIGGGLSNPLNTDLLANNYNITGVQNLTTSSIAKNGNGDIIVNSGLQLGSNSLHTDHIFTNDITALTGTTINVTDPIDMLGSKIIDLGEPTDNNDATTKIYVDENDSALQSQITNNANNISNNALNISNVQNQADSNTSSISANTNNISINSSNISTLQSGLSTTNNNLNIVSTQVNTNTSNIFSNLALINTKCAINDNVENSTTETWSNYRIFNELSSAGTPDFQQLQGINEKVNLNAVSSQPTFGRIEIYTALTNLSAGQPVIFDYGSNGELSVKAIPSTATLPTLLNQQIAGINLNTIPLGFQARVLIEGFCTVRRTSTNDSPPVGTALYIDNNDVTRVSEFDTSNLSAGCVVAYADYTNDSVFCRVKRSNINRKIHSDIALIHEPNLYYQFLAYEKDGNDTYQIDYEGDATVNTDVNGNKYFYFPNSNSLIVDNSFRTKAYDITFAFYIKTWGSGAPYNNTTLLTGIEKFYDVNDAEPRMPSIVYALVNGVYKMIVTSNPRLGNVTYHSMPNARQNDVLVIISLEYISPTATQLRIYNSVDDDIVINTNWGDDRFDLTQPGGDPTLIKAGMYGKQFTSASDGLELYGCKVYNKAFTSLLEFQNVTKESFLLTDEPIYQKYNNAFVNDNVVTGNTAYSSIYMNNRLQQSPQQYYYSFKKNTNNLTNGFYIDDYIQLGWSGLDQLSIKQPFTSISNTYCLLLNNNSTAIFPSGTGMNLTTTYKVYYETTSGTGFVHFIINQALDDTHPLYDILMTIPSSSTRLIKVVVKKYIL